MRTTPKWPLYGWMGIVEHSVRPFCVMREGGRLEDIHLPSIPPSFPQIPCSLKFRVCLSNCTHALVEYYLEQVRENCIVRPVCTVWCKKTLACLNFPPSSHQRTKGCRCTDHQLWQKLCHWTSQGFFARPCMSAAFPAKIC